MRFSVIAHFSLQAYYTCIDMQLPILQNWSKLEKYILTVICALILFLFIVPLILLPFKKQSIETNNSAEITKTISLGTIRTHFAQKSKRIVVITLELVIKELDKDFLDEVSLKKSRLKASAQSYIQQAAGSGTQQELTPLLSQGLQDTLNGLLYLGKIDTVILKNFEIIE